MLPVDDQELDRLIAETVTAKDLMGFMYVGCGALSAGRRVDARHLHHGAMLIPHDTFLGSMSWHMEGDVAANLVAAVRDTCLIPKNAATALFVAAAWCKEYQQGAWPKDLIALARILSRATKATPDVVFLSYAVGQVIGDPGLTTLLAEREVKPPEEMVQTYCEAMLAGCRTPVLLTVPVAQPKLLANGMTMRRAVAKVGRNDPCPCGSGRKHKQCCAEKDQSRLHQSSNVAGLTKLEVSIDPERHLTPQRLKETPPHEMARFDPIKVPVALQPDYLLRLAESSLVDEAVEGLEKVGYRPEVNEAWRASAYFVAQAGRRDLLERLLALREDRATAMKDDVGIGGHLLLAGDDVTAVYKALDQLGMEALELEEKKDPDCLKHLAFGLLACRLRPLGIFVARGVMPFLSKPDASYIFDFLLRSRDKLNLSPDDPFAEVLEKRLLEPEAGEGKNEESLREAQRRLEEKAKEVRQLKESLDALHRQMERREKAPAKTPATAAPAPVPDEAASREMRDKVEKLKSALKERHEERNELRRELQQAHADLESLRENAPPSSREETNATDAEEALLLPEEQSGSQPVRIIEFPKGFQEKLSSLPKSVARGTMTMLGRVAAGEPSAFVGAVRLKACPAVLRLRMGIDFRLLFRLLPDRVEVVDLIPRQDLERRIKTLLKTARAT